MEQWWDSLQASGWQHMAMTIGVRIAGALALLLIGIRVARWIADLTERSLHRAHVEPTATSFLRKVAYVVLLVVLTLTTLGVVGVPLTSMVAVLGAAGLAVGLALKDSLANIASGVMLVTLKPFRVGDVVTINGETGKVEEVSIFQTRLRGPDNQVFVLPNGLITADSIINHTPDTMRRVEIVVGIGYEDDIDNARGIILDVLGAEPRILAEPKADVMLYELADNSVNLGVRCHVGNDDWFAVKCELTEQIKKRFDAGGISIPFPQRDVHMYHHAAKGGDGPATARIERVLPGNPAVD